MHQIMRPLKASKDHQTNPRTWPDNASDSVADQQPTNSTCKNDAKYLPKCLPLAPWTSKRDTIKRHKTVVSFKPPLAKCLYFWSLFTVCSIVLFHFREFYFPFISLIYSRPSISWMFAGSIKCHIKCHKIVRRDVLIVQEVGDQWQKKAKVKSKQILDR